MGARHASFAGVIAALLLAPPLAAQRQISGSVTRSSNNAPIAEAVISAAGSQASARTGADGRFTLTVPAGEARLTVRAIGFTRKDVAVPAGSATVAVRLDEDVFRLEEVVVSGQASTLERRTATRAVATVASEELLRAPAASLEQALQGKVLGATINMNSGAPGGGGQIQIRGATSILGNGQPLFVVDGVIIDNSAISVGTNAVTGAGAGIGSNQDQVVNRLADINPSEVETIEVLKGANATAIYGSRATNGVVLITTKRGTTSERPRVTLSQAVGVASPLRLYDLRCFSSEAEAIDRLENWWGDSPDARAATATAFAGGAAPCVNHQEAFYSNRSPAYRTVGTVSGGSGNTRYFASLTHDNEEGLATNTNRKLTSVRLNLDNTFSPKWKSALGFNFARNLLRRGLGNNDNSFTSPVYNFAYTPSYWDLRNRDDAGNYVTNPFPAAGAGSASNPFETFEFLKADESTWRQIGNASVTFTPVTTGRHNLSFTALAGIDRWQLDGDIFSPSYLQYEQRPGLGGAVVSTTSNQLNFNMRVTGSWTYSPQSDLTLTTSAGASYETQENDTFRNLARTLLPGVENYTQGTQTNEQVKNTFRDEAIFGDLQVVALNQRLVLNGGVRADRSSANGDVEKFYAYPRASGAYTFESPITGINSLKFRGSWGRSGNRPNFGVRYLSFGNAGGAGLIDGRPAQAVGVNIGNPNIRPETLTEVEGGIDATLFGSRAQLEVTAYRRKITDLLLQPALAQSTGFTTQFINGGELETKGIEAGITVNVLANRDVNWLSRVTFQKNSQKTTSLPGSVAPFFAANSFGASFGRNRICAGCSTTAIWGFALYDAQGNLLPLGAAAEGRPAGAVRRDTIIGEANPDFQMFFSNSVSFKRWTLSAQVDWRKGGQVANMTMVLLDEGGTTGDWTDASPVEGMPLGEYRYNSWAFGQSGVYLEDASNLRLRDISISYDAPPSMASFFGAQSLRFSVQGRNLFMLTDYRGYDPEFNNFGNQNLNRFIDLAPYPLAKSFHFLVDLSF